MKAIRILKCSDTRMWYRDHIGKVVPFLREEATEYLSREPAGYTNIVKKQDAEVVDAPLCEILYLRRSE